MRQKDRIRDLYSLQQQGQYGQLGNFMKKKPSDPNILKVCFNCKHFGLSPAEADLGEYSAGRSMSIYCGLAKWEFNEYEGTSGVFKEKLSSAATCPEFEP